MKTLFLTAFAGAALVGGSTTLSTKYATDRALKVDIESTTTLESKMEAEGGETGGRPGGTFKSETTINEIHVDRVLEATDGKPTKVRRTFEKVGGTSTTIRDEERTREMESPFRGVALEMTVGKDGEIEYAAVEGKKPDGEKAMNGHRPEMFLDGLLPKVALEVGGNYDLEKDAINHALRLDVRRGMFPPPERPEGGGNGGGGGGRRGGGMRGGGGDNILDGAEWKGTGTLIAIDKDVDGITCAVIELELVASGERVLPEMRGGRRGGAFEPETMTIENKMSYDASLSGKLYFAVAEKHPVKLDLEGKIHTDSHMEFPGRDETTVKTRMTGDGKLEFKVDVSEVAVSEKKSEKTAK